MQRYDEDLGDLMSDRYATAEDAAAGWAAASAMDGAPLCDRVTMLTRSDAGAWTRWTMRRTGDAAPAAEWAVMRSFPCDAPDGFDD